MIKSLKPYTVWTDEDEAVRVVRIPANARARKAGLTVATLRDAGIVERPGCDCRHCANDWDCCGRMVPGRVTIERVRRGFRVSQQYSRNI